MSSTAVMLKNLCEFIAENSLMKKYQINRSWQDWASSMEDSEEIKKRAKTEPGDRFYLCLSDLQLWMEKNFAGQKGAVLDYGCGGSPYRHLVPEASYKRADVEGLSNLDYVVHPDLPLEAPDCCFDAVISTQVLEHVADFQSYLKDCCRLLKPGGRLLLTTHGSFEDHGMPHDYYRWTGFGLHRELELAGLNVIKINKLTVGPRYLIHVIEGLVGSTSSGKSGIFSLPFGLLRVLMRQRPLIQRLHEWTNLNFSSYRITGNDEERAFRSYVGLALEAQKPVT